MCEREKTARGSTTSTTSKFAVRFHSLPQSQMFHFFCWCSSFLYFPDLRGFLRERDLREAFRFFLHSSWILFLLGFLLDPGLSVGWFFERKTSQKRVLSKVHPNLTFKRKFQPFHRIVLTEPRKKRGTPCRVWGYLGQIWITKILQLKKKSSVNLSAEDNLSSTFGRGSANFSFQKLPPRAHMWSRERKDERARSRVARSLWVTRFWWKDNFSIEINVSGGFGFFSNRARNAYRWWMTTWFEWIC